MDSKFLKKRETKSQERQEKDEPVFKKKITLLDKNLIKKQFSPPNFNVSDSNKTPNAKNSSSISGSRDNSKSFLYFDPDNQQINKWLETHQKDMSIPSIQD